MDIRTRIRGLLLRAALLVAALGALTLIINLSWFDEPLQPELERLKTPQPVSMEDNAYPLVYGFPAADDKDPRATGLAIVEALRERYRVGRMTLSEEELSQILGGSGLDDAWRASFSSLPCNSRLALDCAERLIAEIEQVEPNQPRLEVLLDRYETILRAARFEENQEFDPYQPMPAYTKLLLPVGRIRLAASYEHEPTQAFLTTVAEDVAFWKRMLSGGQLLIAKMVALAGLQNDLAFLSALMRERDLTEEEVQSVRQFLRPLTSEEGDIGDAFRSEMRIAVVYGSSMVGPPLRLLLQEHATLNEYFLSIIVPMQLRASLSPEEFYRERGYERLSYNVRAFPPPLFNLGGKLALEHLTPLDLQDYITRVHDLDGRISLVLLQTELERSPQRNAQAIVSASSHRNPYTGDAMDYDEGTQTIGFDCLEGSSNDVCAVMISPLGR